MNNLIFLRVKTQHENLGDAVINQQLIRRVRKNGRLFIDTAKMPRGFLETVGISSSEALDTTSFFALLIFHTLAGLGTNRIYYFFTPGGLSGGASKAVYWKQLTFLSFCFMLKFMGVRFCRYGVSINNLDVRRQKLELLRAKLLWRNYVRDTSSFKYLTEFGVRPSGVAPDLAFSLPSSSIYAENRDKIVVSLRPDNGGDYSADLIQSVNDILRIVANERDLKVVISAQVSFDVPGMELIASRIEAASIEVLDTPLDDVSSARLYAGAHVVISNRLHVLLFAARQNAQILAVGNIKKIEGIFTDNGLTDNIFKRSSNGSRVFSLRESPDFSGIFDRNSAIIENTFDEIFRD